MRTTIRLPQDLLLEAKRHANKTGRTLTSFMEDAVRMALNAEMTSPQVARETIPTYGKGGLKPGVDLDDSAALLDLMEEEDQD
jgi:hypothetical protein